MAKFLLLLTLVCLLCGKQTYLLLMVFIMDPKQRNRKRYMTARRETGCSQNDWARLFNLQPDSGVKHRQKGQSNVAAKELGSKGVNLAECLASELLLYLHNQGFDVKGIAFDSEGQIVSIPSRAIE